MANEWYAIAANAAALAALVASGNSNLSVQPHPTEYHEAAEQVGVAGDGTPIELGAPTSTWTYGAPLSAAEWKELMDFVGTSASVTAYIRTRTNQTEADGTYQYSNYQCVMWRPTGQSTAYYRFEGVEVKFTQLVAV